LDLTCYKKLFIKLLRWRLQILISKPFDEQMIV